MEAHLFDWMHLLVRWLHFIVGVAWIGASFYFVFLENNLDRLSKREGIAGDLWAVHGGGFYFLEKFKVGPEKMPEKLHWFKYEAYFTWLSGFALLSIVYYSNANLYMVDSSKFDLSGGMAVGIGLAALAMGWIVYDQMCKSFLAKNQKLLALLGYGMTVALAFRLSEYLNDRGVYMHIGALWGTCMAANVFFVIIPSQKKMVESYKNSTPLDPALGAAALMRSKHNNYMTLPVLFVMISNHFPMTFSHENSNLILAVIILFGVVIRHWFNLKGQGKPKGFLVPVAILLLACLIYLTKPAAVAADTSDGDQVSYSQVQAIIENRCVSCHSANPTDDVFTVAPAGVVFNDKKQVQNWASRIKDRVVVLKNMPFANKTGITDEERIVLGRWVDQGASIK